MKMNGETTLSTIPKPERPLRQALKANGSQVDWEELRRKVLESSSRLDWTDDVPPDILEQTWARRAVRIAQATEAEETGAQIDIAVVRLGKELYGLEARYVFDIHPLDNLTRVPRVPDWVAGVVNMRGRIITVLDLQRFLGLPPAEKKDDELVLHHLVLVETPTMELALLVDEVLAIETLPIAQIQETTGNGHGIRSEYMCGIFVRHSKTSSAVDNATLLVILNFPALLADKRLIVQDEII